MDKGEIIKALECCCESDSFDKPNCKDCPADCSYGFMSVPFIQQVLALLKEQEAKTPVECEHDGYWYYTCPTCGNHEELFREWNYCPFCGQAVKWE